MLQGSPGEQTAAGERSCFWPGSLMATPSFLRTDTWVQSEDAALWHSGKAPFLMTSLHWEDWILAQRLDLVVVPSHSLLDMETAAGGLVALLVLTKAHPC